MKETSGSTRRGQGGVLYFFQYKAHAKACPCWLENFLRRMTLNTFVRNLSLACVVFEGHSRYGIWARGRSNLAASDGFVDQKGVV